jgi:phosphate/sulfate permease
MYRIFDYMYYRATKFYKDRNDAAPEVGGVVLVSFVQVLIVIDLLIFLLTQGILSDLHESIKTFGIAFAILSLILNSFRYHNKNRHDILSKKWSQEKQNARDIKTVIFFGFVIVSVILLFTHGGIKQN